MSPANFSKSITLDKVLIEGEYYLKISNSDLLRPFFMSIVSDSDHWLFISSNGGLTAGRKNAECALFPYYTDDKITESADITGSKSIFQVIRNGQLHIWEPFSERLEHLYNYERNLYKSIYANKIRFEETHLDLQLTFYYEWNSSDEFGFVKKSGIINNGTLPVEIQVLDGIQNILPYGVPSDLQNNSSNLVDAYKSCELDKDTGVGIFGLSAIITDRAEPSESLKCNIVWSMGFENPVYLLSSLQLKQFRKGEPISQEEDVKAEKGAYFISGHISLSPLGKKQWILISNVNQSQVTISKLKKHVLNPARSDQTISEDITAGTRRLIKLVAAADGLQLTSDHRRDIRHYSNVLFNIMRGGIFDHHYQIEKWDFTQYISKANLRVFEKNKQVLNELNEEFPVAKLRVLALQNSDASFTRLCLEYLPLKFSRRHGDPSRPWNKFSINTRNEKDGSKILDYEGNWRDIFQNWEALVYSYPAFIDSMIHKFLNATTFDGYNPYRVTKDGFDWESIEPDNPWSYIGYWGDHQIIYLVKFLEFSENYSPGKLASYLDRDLFVYANVPYKIKSYSKILKNPKSTIEFDHELDRELRFQKENNGSDAALLCGSDGEIFQVNLLEKLMATTLAKISNFIPEGGIWMNTQRPEWNDANNALVGNGVSLVTLCYLRRFLLFFKKILSGSKLSHIKISKEFHSYFQDILQTLKSHQHLLSEKIHNKNRKDITDALGLAASDFRMNVYKHSFRGEKATLDLAELNHFIDLFLLYTDHSIAANKRTDHLYHAYNLMTIESENEISLSNLSVMLEGQVAILSSGYLSSEETLLLLDSLEKSALYRPDQDSYLLYPDRELPRFMDKNQVAEKELIKSTLLKQLLAEGNTEIIEKDYHGYYHFNANFKNSNDLEKSLDALSASGYSAQVKADKERILQIFETVFNHKAFTGRSGTFFGYEGLGSIYWHMVSKLLLAVEECCLKALEEDGDGPNSNSIVAHYYKIIEGIGVHKSPSLYGAFPTDPYSHTPAGKGAQQPGMTGQVKEDILSRLGELGVFIKNGQLHFNPCLLRKQEFLTANAIFEYVDIYSNHRNLNIETGSLAFTFCQVPILYQLSTENSLKILLSNGNSKTTNTFSLSPEDSQEVFDRTGYIECIEVKIKDSILR